MKPTYLLSAALMVLLIGTTNLEAQQGRHSADKNKQGRAVGRTSADRQKGNPHDAVEQRTYEMKRDRVPRPYPPNDATIIHDRRGRTDRDFRERSDINFHGRDYVYSGGRYYMKHENDFRIVPPPFGIRVRIIPGGFFTLRVGGLPYFYYEGVYYRHYPEDNCYEVVKPPMGAIVPDLPDYGVRTLYINGMTVLEYDGVLYKPVHTRWGVEYKVVGILNDNFSDDLYY